MSRLDDVEKAIKERSSAFDLGYHMVTKQVTINGEKPKTVTALLLRRSYHHTFILMIYYDEDHKEIVYGLINKPSHKYLNIFNLLIGDIARFLGLKYLSAGEFLNITIAK